ncbi:unnamed protein product [Spirodela intermedia]|uniref:DUF7653 domain-containing protein n=1 Tax=Spirodela intermedia TaxID=51605 RepID=A0A7I8KCE4_SPIIN|nr:unnamed protein product [Spirodela intermedia]
MRRFFSFRSSSSSEGKENPVPSVTNDENVFWEANRENFPRNAIGAEIRSKSPTSKASDSPHLRRSLSFSSSTPYSREIEGRCNSYRNLSGSLSDYSNIPHQSVESPIRNLPPTPEKFRISQRYGQETSCKVHGQETSSRSQHCSPVNSPHSSPVPLRCRSSRVTQRLDIKSIPHLCIEEGQNGKKSRDGSHPPFIGNYGHLAEKRIHPNSGRPPKSQYTTPLATSVDENLCSLSFREAKDGNNSLSSRDEMGSDFGHVSPNKPARKFSERESSTFHGKAKVNFLDNESQTTTTVEDIYEDTSNSLEQKCSLSDHISLDNILDRYSADEALSHRGQGHSSWDDSTAPRHDSFHFLGMRDDHFDADLLMKLNDVEEQVKAVAELADPDEIWSGRLSTSGLVHMLRSMAEERRNLASELSLQLRCRISERSSTREALNQAKRDLDTRTRRLEREKDELQSSLEKELDRRSSDWSFKLEKFQAEEQRLRERVRELAEQNVSIQREVSCLSGKKMEAQDHIMNLESKLNGVTIRLEEMRSENATLHEALSDLQEQFNTAKADEECIKRSYKETDMEAKELMKTIAKLQIVCSEQEKTITGLRQGYIEPTGKQPEDLVRTLKVEHVRLAGVEQTLRKEIESLRIEVDSLKHEKTFLLGRLRSAGSSCSSFYRIDQELHSQMECLQNEAFSLLDDGDDLCDKLLKVASNKRYDHGTVALHGSDGYSVAEHNMKLQSLRRAVKKFKGRLQSMSTTLDQRSRLGGLESQPHKTETGISIPHDDTLREDSMELMLKAETLITALLREKLLHRELELERLQSELGSSVRGKETLQSEIIRLQDHASCLTHEMKDVEHQVRKKEESISRLQHDLEECTKELMVGREMLPRVSEERDRLWEELKQSRETNMFIDYELKTLKKKIEALEEEILMKEGQITILRDSMGKQIL